LAGTVLDSSYVVSTFVEGEVADFADHVDGTGGDDEAVWRGYGPGLSKSSDQVWGGVGRDIEGVGGGEEVFEGGGAGVVDGGKDDVILRAVGAGVEEGEEDLGHLAEVFVAEAGEEEGAGLGFGIFGKLRDGSAEGPGSGGVVGYVEEEAGAFGESDELEAAGPLGVADSRFNVGVCDFVTVTVAYCLVWVGGVAQLFGGGYGEGEVALLVVAGEGGADFEGLIVEG